LLLLPVLLIPILCFGIKLHILDKNNTKSQTCKLSPKMTVAGLFFFVKIKMQDCKKHLAFLGRIE
ncbi:MAG: hypothetical protein WAT50_06335, partial [Ruminococcus bromii]